MFDLKTLKKILLSKKWLVLSASIMFGTPKTPYEYQIRHNNHPNLRCAQSMSFIDFDSERLLGIGEIACVDAKRLVNAYVKYQFPASWKNYSQAMAYDISMARDLDEFISVHVGLRAMMYLYHLYAGSCAPRIGVQANVLNWKNKLKVYGNVEIELKDTNVMSHQSPAFTIAGGLSYDHGSLHFGCNTGLFYSDQRHMKVRPALPKPTNMSTISAEDLYEKLNSYLEYGGYSTYKQAHISNSYAIFMVPEVAYAINSKHSVGLILGGYYIEEPDVKKLRLRRKKTLLRTEAFYTYRVCDTMELRAGYAKYSGKDKYGQAVIKFTFQD